MCFVHCKTFVFLSFLQQNYKSWLVFAMVVNVTFFPVICSDHFKFASYVWACYSYSLFSLIVHLPNSPFSIIVHHDWPDSLFTSLFAYMLFDVQCKLDVPTDKYS